MKRVKECKRNLNPPKFAGSRSRPQPVLPDPEICRTVHMERFKHISKCVADGSVRCPYSILHEKDCLCIHQDAKSFLED